MDRCRQHSTIRAKSCLCPVPTSAPHPAPPASPRAPVVNTTEFAAGRLPRKPTFVRYGKERVKERVARVLKLGGGNRGRYLERRRCSLRDLLPHIPLSSPAIAHWRGDPVRRGGSTLAVLSRRTGCP